MSLDKTLAKLAPTKLFSALTAGSRNVRLVAFGFALVALGACSDMPTAPGGLDRGLVETVMPSVSDARLRLTNGLNVALRQQVILKISDLETALRQGDAQQSRNCVKAITSVLDTYRSQPSSAVGADVSAIFLMLGAVSNVVDGPSVQP